MEAMKAVYSFNSTINFSFLAVVLSSSGLETRKLKIEKRVDQRLTFRIVVNLRAETDPAEPARANVANSVFVATYH